MGQGSFVISVDSLNGALVFCTSLIVFLGAIWRATFVICKTITKRIDSTVYSASIRTLRVRDQKLLEYFRKVDPEFANTYEDLLQRDYEI